MDHHCVIIHNCVGLHNIKFFLYTIFYGSLGAVFTCVTLFLCDTHPMYEPYETFYWYIFYFDLFMFKLFGAYSAFNIVVMSEGIAMLDYMTGRFSSPNSTDD